MQQHGAPGSVSGSLVQMFLGRARDMGLPVPRELEVGALERLSAAHFLEIWNQLETLSPTFGLRLGALPGPLPTGHILFAVMANSPSVGQALAHF